MNKIYVQFLQIIKCSLYNENIEFKKEENVYWSKIFNIARRHKVLPMAYKTSCNNENFKNLDLNMQRNLNLSTNQMIIWQTLKRKRFLQVYKLILKSNIKLLVFRGIILSNLYANSQYRVYDEEDIFIKKEDIEKCEEILLENDFTRILKEYEDEDVRNYICNKTNLHIQLHTILFTKEYDDFQLLNNMFECVFENSTLVNINHNQLYTFSVNDHFLYMSLYEIKHFLNFGMRIRQLCDISMYIHVYHDEINWKYIWENVDSLGYETLFVNILEICIKYLGLNEKYIEYVNDKNTYYINEEELIEDIIDGGMYGLNSQQKSNSSYDDYYRIRPNLKKIFNNRKILTEKYTYLKKHPCLLPLALCSEILHANKYEKSTIEDKNPRTNLLKKYKIMN